MGFIRNLAALITVITALFNLGLVILQGEFSLPLPAIRIALPNEIIKFLFFAYLQLALSVFFYFIISKIWKRFEKLDPFIVIIFFPLIVAFWLCPGLTFIFNIEWIYSIGTWDYSSIGFDEITNIALLTLAATGIMAFSIVLIEEKIEGKSLHIYSVEDLIFQMFMGFVYMGFPIVIIISYRLIAYYWV